MSSPDLSDAATAIDATAPPADPTSTRPDNDDPLQRLTVALRKCPTGSYARLRRFHPLRQTRAVTYEVESVLDAAEISTADPDLAQRWALVVHCLALARGRHGMSAATATGQVLARLQLKEMRLRQLLDADFELLADLLPRLARRLDAASATLDWRPLADLLLHAGSDREARADQARRRIVRGYIGAGKDRDQPAAATNDPSPQP